jgi:hypothetical protein
VYGRCGRTCPTPFTPSWRDRLIYGIPHVVWQYDWTGRQLTTSVWVPGSVPAGGVEAAIHAARADAAITAAPASPPIPLTVDAATRRHLLPVHAD